MNILITNDDGILSQGICSLAQKFSTIGNVYVAAPEVECSGAGHSINISTPLKTKRHNIDGADSAWAVKGTPADCVKLAISSLLPARPDLLISGINAGPNIGVSILYSGTVGAAAEGAVQHIPSIAVSLGFGCTGSFDTAAEYTRTIYETIGLKNFPKRGVININVPAIPDEDIKGIRIVRHSQASFNEFYQQAHDPWGREYFWIDGKLKYSKSPDVDAYALEKGFVTVTPLQFDWTSEPHYTEFKKLFRE